MLTGTPDAGLITNATVTNYPLANDTNSAEDVRLKLFYDTQFNVGGTVRACVCLCVCAVPPGCVTRVNCMACAKCDVRRV